MINKNFIIALTISFVASIELNAQTPGKQTPTPKTTINFVKPVETNSKNSTTATNLQKKPTDTTTSKLGNTNNPKSTTTYPVLKINMEELRKDSLKRDQALKDARSNINNGKRIETKSVSAGG